MGYHVEVEHQAAKILEKMQRGDRASARRLDQAIQALANEPRPANATKMVGADAWRLRVGDYRIVYVIEDAIRVITVTRIGHRRDVYDR